MRRTPRAGKDPRSVRPDGDRAQDGHDGSDVVVGERRPTGSSVTATMRDIAEATGVSQSTVSRVLSGTRTAVPIAEATRKRVMESARRLGYRPNPLARGLRGAPTKLIGVIVRDVTDPFFAGAIEAASLEANERGYNVVLGHAHRSAVEAQALASILEARHCDALLFLGDLHDRPGLGEELRDCRLPVVALWHGSGDSDIPTVSVDNDAGIGAVIDHLVSLDHEGIAFAGPRRLGDIAEREQAYRSSLARHGLSAHDACCQDCGNDFSGGTDVLARLLDLESPPTAIVAATDVIAIGMLCAAHDRGLIVPDDISIVGFDDIPVAQITIPTLTTVRMPTEAMTVAAMDLLVGSPDGCRLPEHPVFTPELVVRASTGPAAARGRWTEATLEGSQP